MALESQKMSIAAEEGGCVGTRGGVGTRRPTECGGVGTHRPTRQRMYHRGPLNIDVSAAWYFITICAEGHAPWVIDDGRAVCPHTAVPFDEIARMILSAARWYHEHHKWRLALFLVMPDHLHLIAHFPNGGVGDDGGVGTRRPTVMETVVGEFKKYLSRQLKIRFQRDFFDTRIRNDAHFAEKYNYILGNPVRKDLCATASDWPYVIAFNREGNCAECGGVGTLRPTGCGGVGDTPRYLRLHTHRDA